MNVIIVDDEPKAISLIESYLSHFSDFNLIATFRNGLKALEFLNTNTIDVIFLDINMPHLSGLSLSKMVSSKTSIVFTTAYSEHAVESYNVNAIDYLLKPINLERFSKTIAKLIEQKKTPLNNNLKLDADVIFVKSGLQTHQIKVAEINYLQKDGNYMYYFLNDKKIMARESIADAISNLPDNFIQIQKSYIANFTKINSISSDTVSINQHKIPIGSTYKAMLLEKMK